MTQLYRSFRYRFKQWRNPPQDDSEVIWFVSFPKSGRTWIHLMTAYVASSLSGLPIGEFLDKHPKTYLHKSSQDTLPFVTFGHGYYNHKICKGNYFPTEFYMGKRIVLLVRDPRDTVVSHYYYQKWHYEEFDGTLSEFVHYPYQNAEGNYSRYGIVPIINYMNAWMENQHIFRDMIILRYEDWKADVYTNLKHYLDSVGFPVSEALLIDTIDYGSFDNMRKLEESNTLDWHALGGAKSKKGFKTRQGKRGKNRQELSSEDLMFINNHINTSLHPQFDYYYLGTSV